MEKFGPCPLCGGRASLRIPGYAACMDDRCPMPQVNEGAWGRLSAMAVNEKRMREELELMDLFAKEHAEIAVHERDLDAADDWEWIRGRCREALKGGKG